MYDIIIIGTGAGGGTLAWALRNTGARILLIERGTFLPQEKENWDANAIFFEHRYKPSEKWETSDGLPFQPGVQYWVGGNTKVYGAALPRFRKENFETLEHEGGVSPAWPIRYADLEPYYTRAEVLYRVHGTTGEDPTDPVRSAPYPFPAVAHEEEVDRLARACRKQGLHPSHLPMGIDLRSGGRCIRCHTCDGYPCQIHAKSDADICCVRPALESDDMSIMTEAWARRLVANPAGNHIEAVEVEVGGDRQVIRADRFVVACGAVNSAALLLRSREGGLANTSGLVGRNYMVHNNTGLIAARLQQNKTTFQKTLSINDFYLRGPKWPYPLGNLQIVGKVQAAMLHAMRPYIPRTALGILAHRSIDWWIMSEDLPDKNNRVTITPTGGICVHWVPNNMATHNELVRVARSIMKEAGYPLVFTEPMGIATNSHQCGTLRFGKDPGSSVLDPWCRAHDIPNLYVVDSSFFPSSAAMNPALTIAAQALRVGDHLTQPT